jgi:MATE family multidrug resistance protein
MICSEWWAFEIVALLAGLLGNKTLAAQTIVLNTSTLAYMLPLGISVASSTRIGNCLGGQMPFRAKMASRAALLVAFVIAGLNCGLLFGIRHSWGWLWTTDAEVVQIVSTILPLAALFQFSDGLGAVGGGVLRGAGLQKTGAFINLAGYYLLGLPLGGILAFKYTWGLPGLWIGLTTGLITVSFILLWIIYRMDWEGEANRAMALLIAGGESNHQTRSDLESGNGKTEEEEDDGVMDEALVHDRETEALLTKL